MIRFLTAVFLIAFLVMPPAALSQTTINPNQIARGSAITTLNPAVAVGYCGSTPGCEWHINGPASPLVSVTIPSNVTLVFEGGGQLVVPSGATVTINGKVTAPPGVQIFAGAGSVAGIHQVNPAWYSPTYTLAQLAALIPDVPDATILPWSGTLDSGTEIGVITRSFLTIMGSGVLAYNADFSGFAAGASVIQGQLNLSIPNFHIAGVASDLGSYQAAHGGWCAGDPSGNNGTGNLVDAKLPGGNSSNITIAFVSTLGCSAMTQGHSILVEGFDGVRISNIHTHFNTRGVVSKSSNTLVSDIDSREHGQECLIFKSDSTNGGINLVNLTATDVTCTDTALVDIFGDDAGLSNVKFVNLTMTGGYVQLNGYTISHGGFVDIVDITNFRSSGAAGNALQTVGGIGSVSITGGGVYGAGAAGIFANAGFITITNFTAGYLSASAYAIYNNGANITVVGGHGINLANAYIHGVSGTTRYVGSTSDGNAGLVADGNAQLFVPTAYDAWGAGNLTAPYGALNYFAKFTPTDSRFDHASSVTGWGTAQYMMYVANAATNQKRSGLFADSGGTVHLAFFDDTQNGTTGLDAWSCNRNGYTPSGCRVNAPFSAPSVVPDNGFTGTKLVGSCTLTITSGIITAVAGC